MPPRHHAHGVRQPNLFVLLCAGCAGFAPSTDVDYSGALRGWCVGCGRRSRELHRFRAAIDSAGGCTCATHGDPVHGDLHAQPTQHQVPPQPDPSTGVLHTMPIPAVQGASPDSTRTDDGHVISRGRDWVRFECGRPDDCTMPTVCADCAGRRGSTTDDEAAQDRCEPCRGTGIEQPPTCWISHYADPLDALEQDLDERLSRTGSSWPPPGRYALLWSAIRAGTELQIVARFGPALTTSASTGHRSS